MARTCVSTSRFAENAPSHLILCAQNTRETAMAVQGMQLKKAMSYLNQVKNHERCIPFRRFSSTVGRTAQAKEFGVTQGRWPVKSIEFIEGLLKNAEANAEVYLLSPVRVLTVCVGQGIGRRHVADSAHSGQPGPQAAPPHLPCPRSHWPYDQLLFYPFLTLCSLPVEPVPH